MWEEAIILGKELAEQYENEMFDFEQLSALLVSDDSLDSRGSVSCFPAPPLKNNFGSPIPPSDVSETK